MEVIKMENNDEEPRIKTTLELWRSDVEVSYCQEEIVITNSSCGNQNYTFKEVFEKSLIEYDFKHQGSPHKPWVQEKIDDVINELKMIKDCEQKRKPRLYYWIKKYEILSTANEDYLIYRRLSHKDPIVRIMPREKYFDVLLETHKSLKHGGRDKMLYFLKKKYYIPKKAVELFISLCPVCTRKKEDKILPRLSYN